MATLYGKNNREDNEFLQPIFGSSTESKDLPKYKLGDESMSPRNAYQLVSDQLLDEGNSRLNLATFCQTYMEPEAIQLMKETLEKNEIDKSEYPRTAEIENRCVNIIGDLWNAPNNEEFIGTSTIGSSEACMLAGLAMKFKWDEQAKDNNLDMQKQRPNLVISSGYQVCWEKFSVYWDIELREVPIDNEHMSLNMNTVMDYVDEYTIGIVGIMGITYTGEYDNIEKLNELVSAYNENAKIKVYIHVDAASGGFFTPFITPDIKWDFCLENVISINSSGHKYGLVYPGVGWVLWRDKKFVPEKLIFQVSYLGGELPTMAINFSHSAAQLIGQYYNFVRLGFEGYKEIHLKTQKVANYLSQEIVKSKIFKIIAKGEKIPLVCYQFIDNNAQEWNLYDLSDRLLMKGWQVPSYPLPNNLSQQVIQRIVVRADFGMNMAHDFFRISMKQLQT